MGGDLDVMLESEQYYDDVILLTEQQKEEKVYDYKMMDIHYKAFLDGVDTCKDIWKYRAIACKTQDNPAILSYLICTSTEEERDILLQNPNAREKTIKSMSYTKNLINLF